MDKYWLRTKPVQEKVWLGKMTSSVVLTWQLNSNQPHFAICMPSTVKRLKGHIASAHHKNMPI